MLIKFIRAHWYQGERTLDEEHNGRYSARKGRIANGQVRDIPTAYFEKYLEPYDAARPYNVAATEARELIDELKQQNVQQLRDLAEEHELEVVATGRGDRVTKSDLVAALSAAGIGPNEDGQD